MQWRPQSLLGCRLVGRVHRGQRGHPRPAEVDAALPSVVGAGARRAQEIVVR